MSRVVKVPDPVFERATELAEQHDMTIKESIRQMCRDNSGYDV